MASHHASLGRRTLEEIQQKRATERLSTVSSSPDLTKPPIPHDGGIKPSRSRGRLNENDVSSLLSQLKDMQHKNSELADENKILVLKLQAKEADNEMLKKNLNELNFGDICWRRRSGDDHQGPCWYVYVRSYP